MRPPIPKTLHRASKINANGDVSALCYKQPRRIDLSIASWTIRNVSVTCPKCLKAMKAAQSKAVCAASSPD